MPLPVTILLVAWGNVLLATVPHLLKGPLRPIPLGHLAWVLSAAVLVLVLRTHRGTAGPRPAPRTVMIGLFVGLGVGILSGTQSIGSAATGLAIIGLIGLGHESAVALVALVAVALGFHGRLIGDGTPGPPTPPWRTWSVDTIRFNPNAILLPTDSSKQQWLAAADYGGSLFASLGAPEDQQRLTLPDGTPGPLARVWAEHGAYLIDPLVLLQAELGRGPVGRIVARIEVEPDSSGNGYAPLGLYPGVTFLWVDQLDAAAGTARAVLIAGDRSGFRVRQLAWNTQANWQLGTTPDWANYSRARWVYGDRGDALDVSCALAATCRLEVTP